MHISVCSKSAVTKRMRFTWMHEIWMKVSFIMKLLNEDIVLEFYVQSINIIAFWDHSLVHNTIIYQIFPVPRLQNMYQNNTEKIVLTYFVAKFYCFPNILQKLLKNTGNHQNKREYWYKTISTIWYEPFHSRQIILPLLVGLHTRWFTCWAIVINYAQNLCKFWLQFTDWYEGDIPWYF